MSRNIHLPIRASLVLLVFVVVLGAGTSPAETITITLDDVVVASCEEVWQEAGLPLWFTETLAEDYTPGYCLFVADANNFGLEGVYIWPGRLVLDLSGVQGIESVEVDIHETHFAGSTRARLYHEGSQIYYAPSYQEDQQTLTLLNGGDADLFAISAHEAYVWEIRLIGQTLVPNGTYSFDAVKAIYR